MTTSSATTDAEHQPVVGEYAGFASRALAFIIDLLIVVLVLGIGLGLIALIRWFFGNTSITTSLHLNDALTWLFSAATAALTATVAVVYYVGFWALIGITPGKAVMGLQILRSDGSRMTVKRSILRYVGYWLSALPLLLGFFWIIVSRRRQGWHDKLADTVVIYTHSERRAGRW
jgi:uncharacterized RDD family membrane protein YckC